MTRSVHRSRETEHLNISLGFGDTERSVGQDLEPYRVRFVVSNDGACARYSFFQLLEGRHIRIVHICSDIAGYIINASVMESLYDLEISFLRNESRMTLGCTLRDTGSISTIEP